MLDLGKLGPKDVAVITFLNHKRATEKVCLVAGSDVTAMVVEHNGTTRRISAKKVKIQLAVPCRLHAKNLPGSSTLGGKIFKGVAKDVAESKPLTLVGSTIHRDPKRADMIRKSIQNLST